MSGELDQLGPKELEAEPTVADRREERMIKWSSRVGVWGLGGGFLPVIAFTLGAPISLPTAVAVMSGAFAVGGVATAAASFLIRRRSRTRVLRLAGALGMPLGMVFAGVGVSTLLGWQIVSSVGGIAMAGLGLAVLILLIAGFAVRWNEASEDDTQPT